MDVMDLVLKTPENAPYKGEKDFSVVIACDDTTAARVCEILQLLNENLQQEEGRLLYQLRRLETLAFVEMQEPAAVEAAAADMIIIGVRDGRELQGMVADWIKRCLDLRAGRPGVLVAVVEAELEAEDAQGKLAQLRAAAALGRLDFFALGDQVGRDAGLVRRLSERVRKLILTQRSGRLGGSPGGRKLPAETQAEGLAWYCARTKPKHEHIAAVHLRKNLNLEVFQPQLRVEHATRRGIVRVVEPLFPGYIFVRCVLEQCLDEVQHANGVQHLVHFGHRIPTVPDSIVAELQECFEMEDTLTLEDRIFPGDEVTIGEGALSGMHAFVLRLMPARKRVQVLINILGGSTPVEVDRSSVVLERNTLAEMVPVLAAAN